MGGKPAVPTVVSTSPTISPAKQPLSDDGTPLGILADAGIDSPELLAWAKHWQGDASHAHDAVALADLQTTLDANRVPPLVRLRVAAMLVTAKDPPTAAVWARSGLVDAIVEWPSDSQVQAMSPKVVWDLITTAADPFWKTGDREGLQALIDVERLLPRRNEWDQQPEWHRINFARVLLTLHDYKGALQEVASLRADAEAQVRPNQETRLRLVEAAAHIRLGQFDQAQTLLETPGLFKGPEAKEADQLLAEAAIAADEAVTPTALSVLQAHVASHNAKVPAELTDWVTRWQAASSAARPSDPATLAVLAPAIAASDLSANERLKVGQLLFAAGDKAAAATWFHAGIDQAKTDFDGAIATAPNDAAKAAIAQKVLTPLLGKFEVAGNMLWEQFDGAAEQKLTEMVMLLPRSGPSSQRPEWAKIGHAEALYVQGRLTDSLREVEEIFRAPKNTG